MVLLHSSGGVREDLRKARAYLPILPISALVLPTPDLSMDPRGSIRKDRTAPFAAAESFPCRLLSIMLITALVVFGLGLVLVASAWLVRSRARVASDGASVLAPRDNRWTLVLFINAGLCLVAGAALLLLEVV